MTGGSDHEAFQDLLAPYALDAVSQEEAVLVSAHLDHCPRCRAEVDGFREVAAALGNSNSPLPSHLWDRIADGLAQEWDEPATLPEALRRQLGSPSTRPGPVPPVSGVDAVGSDERWEARHTVGVASGKSRRGSSRRLRFLAAAASLVLLAGLGVGLASLEGQSPGRGTEAQSLRSGVAAALSNPRHQLITMRDPEGRTVAQVVMANGHGYLFADSLATLSPERTYQLWGVYGGHAISLGLLGSQPRVAAFSPGSSRPSAIMVTVEPSGGVIAPDRFPVATGAPT